MSSMTRSIDFPQRDYANGSREVVEQLIAEYKAAEKPEFVEFNEEEMDY
jgi:hypothetical protein